MSSSSGVSSEELKKLERTSLILGYFSAASILLTFIVLKFIPLLSGSFADIPFRLYADGAVLSFWKTSHSLWGYDPYFMAGYPLDFTVNGEVVPAMLRAVSGFSPVATYEVFLVLCTILAPYFLMRSSALLGAERLASYLAPISCLFVLFGLWFMIVFTGGYSGGFLLVFAVYGIAAFSRYLYDKTNTNLLRFAIALSIALLLHRTALVAIGVPVTAMLIFDLRGFTLREFAKLASLTVAAFVPSLAWIVSSIENARYIRFSDAKMPILKSLDPLLPLKDLVSGRLELGPAYIPNYYPAFVVALACVVLLILFIKYSRSPQKRSIIVATLSLAFVGYYGGFLPLFEHTEPLRYLVVFQLLVFMAASTLERNDWISKLRPSHFKRIEYIVVAFVIVSLVIGHFSHESNAVGDRAQRLDPDSIVNEIPRNQIGRILCEQPGGYFVHHGPLPPGSMGRSSSIGAYLAMKVHRPFIGGPYPYYYSKYSFANFVGDQLFGDDIKSIPERELIEKIARYNITTVVTTMEVAARRFASMPAYFAKVFEKDGFTIFAVKGIAPTYFLANSGTVTFDDNSIDVTLERPGDAVIKFHWHPRLHASGARIEPVKVGDDPIPFIKLVGGTKDVAIRFR